MTVHFADTFYYLALLSKDDNAHHRARQASQTIDGRLVTTAWVLTEFADALASPASRVTCSRFLVALRADPRLTIVPATQEWFDRGTELYADRPDKAWSLTDCISFVVMKQLGITEALTADRHFEQAGFSVLLK